MPEINMDQSDLLTVLAETKVKCRKLTDSPMRAEDDKEMALQLTDVAVD